MVDTIAFCVFLCEKLSRKMKKEESEIWKVFFK